MLQSLVLTSENCVVPNFMQDPWNSTCLVTPRHVVHEAWNDAALQDHCCFNGSQLFICPALNSIRGRPLSNIEWLALAVQKSKRETLKSYLPLAIGMRVLVTLNILTDVDLANGARGTIVGIGLHPDEVATLNATVHLQHCPVYVLVKMDHTRAAALPGLEDGVIPITPASKSFQISYSMQNSSGQLQKQQKTVTRRQFPITGAYALTDYRSQGQTLKTVIVDLAKPPSGGELSLFNIYVALSRSSGRDSIRLLRDFDPAIFSKPLNSYLAIEDD